MNENDTLSNEADVIIEGLTDANTGFDVLAKQKATVRIVNGSIETSPKSGGKYVKLELAVEHSCETVSGKQSPVGQRLWTTIGLSTTEKYTVKMLAENVAKFQECFTGTRQQPFNIANYINLTGKVLVGIESKEGYETKNTVRFIPRKD